MLTATHAHTREKAKYDEGPTGDILRGLGGSGFTLFRKWKHERAQWAEMDDDQKVKRRCAVAESPSPSPARTPPHPLPFSPAPPTARRV